MNRAEQRRLLRDLRRQGFTVVMSRRSHWKVYDPGGSYVTTLALTPSDPRGVANEVARLRRAGFDPDHHDSRRRLEVPGAPLSILDAARTGLHGSLGPNG